MRLQDLSLRLKLTVGYALIFSLSVLLGAGLVYLVARYSLTQTLDVSLSETAALARAGLQTGPNGQQQFASELQLPRELHIELISSAGTVQRRLGVPDPVLDQVPLRPGTLTLYHRRVLSVPLPQGQWLRVSRPSDTTAVLLETLGKVLLAGSVLMIAVACAAGYALADRALRPVDAVAQTARRITRRGSYHERVPAAGGQDEMARLTRTVNEMLDHLEATIEREKAFARTAAHELRTPLTAIQGRLELALERPREAADYRRHLEIMQGRVVELMSLAQGLLTLAETDRAVDLEPTDLQQQARTVVDELRLRAAALGREVQLDVDSSVVPVWAEALGVRQIIRNLLENALKYGGPQLGVQLGPQRLTVWDSGHGPDPQEWARLTRPFERGSGLQSVSGNGLGLPLVVALAERWDATVLPEYAPERFGVTVSWAPDA